MEKRKRLRIWHDSNALNPFEDWDCEPAVMIDYGRNGNFDYSKGEIKSFIDKHLDNIPRESRTNIHGLRSSSDFFR